MKKLSLDTFQCVLCVSKIDPTNEMINITKIKFKEVNLDESEKLFKSYFNETKNYIEQIK